MAKEDYDGRLFEDDYAHATAATRRLTNKWARADRIVVADSYFASVGAAEALGQAGLRFIGCIKSETKGIPMKNLAETEAAGRGFVKSMTCRRDGRKGMMALMLVDRDRKYFISAALPSRTTRNIF